MLINNILGFILRKVTTNDNCKISLFFIVGYLLYQHIGSLKSQNGIVYECVFTVNSQLYAHMHRAVLRANYENHKERQSGRDRKAWFAAAGLLTVALHLSLSVLVMQSSAVVNFGFPFPSV